MTLAPIFVGLATASLAVTASSEMVTWEAAVIGGPGGRKVLARGVKTYSPAKDIIVREGGGRDGRPSWSKSLLLDDTFALSASVYREQSLDGFGLVIYRKGDQNGFSWEWFTRDKGNVFQKLQGTGRVSVGVKKGTGYEELDSVEFLDDIVLRYLDDMAKPPGTHTHEVVVRKGSVFKLGSSGDR
jgi:hypothetical protein